MDAFVAPTKMESSYSGGGAGNVWLERVLDWVAEYEEEERLAVVARSNMP